MVLRIVSLLALVLAAVWLIVYFIKNTGSWQALGYWFTGEVKSAFSKGWLTNWKRTVFILMLLVVAVMALTGFVPFIILGTPLGGFALMLHVALAPVFAVLAAIFVVSRADAHSFDKNSAKFLTTKKHKESLADEFWTKIFFWFMAIFALLVAFMVFSMYPIFGTIGQDKLLNIHRFSSVALFIFIILFTLRLVRLQTKTKAK